MRMEKLMSLAVRNARLVAILVTIATLVALVKIPDLKLEISAEGMMLEGHATRRFYEQTLETFGTENVTIVYLQDADIFSPDNLLLIRQAVAKIDASPLVQRTSSLFSLRYLRTVDDFVYTDPYLAKIPATSQQAEKIRKAALANPLAKGNLISEDGTALAINVYFSQNRLDAEFDKRASALMDEALSPLGNKLETAFHVGDPYVRTGLTERIKDDQKRIVPLALAILVVTLAIALKQFSAAVIPILTAATSIIWTLGLMAALNIPVNVMTSIIPALLIIIGSTEDIHLLTEYRTSLRRTKKPRRALKLMIRHMGTAVSLTFITTYFGFLSIALNPLGLLQQFGLLASTGLLFNFLATVLMVPVLLHWFGKGSKRSTTSYGPGIMASSATRTIEVVQKHRKFVILLIVALLIAGLTGASKLRINNNVMDYFDDDAPLTRYADLLHANLSGMQTFSIILSGPENSFLEVRNLKYLHDLQDFLDNTGYFDKSFSFSDFISVVHGGIDDESAEAFYLPDRNEVVGEYAAMLDQSTLKPFVSPDFSQTKIVVRHNISDSRHLNRVIDEIYDHVALNPAHQLSIQITGESYLNSKAADYMADGQARSLLLMLIVIFVIVSTLFTKHKAGLVAVSANLFPIIMLFGIMGHYGLVLDTGTAMVGAIAMGIAVDHTMHFMVRYNRINKHLGEEHQALVEVVRNEATPIIATTIALAMGFATLTISDFPPVARFGLLSSFVMLMALFSTFVILPLLLWRTRLVSVWDILSIKLKKQAIEKCPLFVDMKPWQIRKLITLAELRDYTEDEAIILQEEETSGLHVLLTGRVEAWKTLPDGSTKRLSVMEPGQFFGASSFVASKPGYADMVAVKGSQVLILEWKALHRIAVTYPRIAVKLLKNIIVITGQLYDKLESTRPTLIDELSGAFNATYFTSLLQQNIERALRDNESLTLLSITLDDSYNPVDDHYGLTRRTANLRKLSESVKAVVRRGDAVCRWKESTFLILLPATDEKIALKLADRILQHTEDTEFFTNRAIDIIISAAVLKKEKTAEELLLKV